MQPIEGLHYQEEWTERAVLCGLPEEAVFEQIERIAYDFASTNPVKMTVSIYRDKVITTIYDELTNNVLTQAECELMDGSCPATTRIYVPHQVPTQTK